MTTSLPTPRPHSSGRQTRLRCPEDLLAAVPVLLGFEPEQSLVMLTFGIPRQFHARIDLPRPEDGPVTDEVVDEVGRSLLDPVVKHRVPTVCLVIYSADDRLARRMGRRWLRQFESAGVHVCDLIRADGQRWYSPAWSRPGVPKHGVPYDVRSHPIRVQSVLEGQVTLASRRELEASVSPDPALVAETASALAHVSAPPDPLEAIRLVWRGYELGELPDPLDRAELLVWLREERARNELWFGLTRAEAPAAVRLWRSLVRAAPDGDVAHASALLGFSAWLTGNGALAWCALDRCLAADPHHGLALLVAGLLEQAVSPDSWAEDHRRDRADEDEQWEESPEEEDEPW